MSYLFTCNGLSSFLLMARMAKRFTDHFSLADILSYLYT